jgi:hypothetical protein
MSGDLIHNHLPRGLTEAQVGALIGQPFDTQKVGDPDAWQLAGVEAHLYEIDSFGEFGIDDAVVRVHYDRNGCLIKAEITHY